MTRASRAAWGEGLWVWGGSGVGGGDETSAAAAAAASAAATRSPRRTHHRLHGLGQLGLEGVRLAREGARVVRFGGLGVVEQDPQLVELLRELRRLEPAGREGRLELGGG